MHQGSDTRACSPAGLVLEPLPVGAWAFLSVTVAVFTKTLTFAQAFTAFTNDVIWLIVVSFFFAKVRSSISVLECLLRQPKSACAAVLPRKHA